MKRVLFFILILRILYSCNSIRPIQEKPVLNIQEFPIDSTSIRAVLAIDSNTMYYAGSGGQVGFTKDAGKTWTKKTIVYQDSIKPEFRSIATDGKAIFVLSVANPALLYKIFDNEVSLVYKETNDKVFYDSMAFFDAKTGLAMGDPIDDCLSIITTVDGGNTWQKIECSSLPKTFDGEAAFAASNTNIKMVNNTVWIVTGGAKARVFKSEDKGVTWQVFSTPIVQGKNTQGIYSVDFIDEQNGIIIGGDYAHPKQNINNKAITKDGGKTWKLVADNQDPNYRSCVQYIPNTKGQELLAVGKMGISYSNDAGMTWQKISDVDYYTIQFVNKNTAWLGGNAKVGFLQLK